MDNRAASSPISTVLLVAIMVVATTIVGASIVTETEQIRAETEKTQVNIEPQITESDVTLQHIGGQSLATEETKILLQGNSGRKGPYKLDSAAVDGRGLSDGLFETGDTVVVNHTFSGYIDIYLFSNTTGEQLYRTLRSTTAPTPISTPSDPDAAPSLTARANALDKVAEGFSITLDGSQSTDTDGSIDKYKWTITSGPGSISDDSTSTPNAVYVAPTSVNADPTVSIELTVTDNDGNENSTSIQITVIDVDTDGGDVGPPGGAAFDDDNGNGVYDAGETPISKSDLENGYNNPDTQLVIPPDVGDLENRNNGIDITAESITSYVNITSRNQNVVLTATDGDIYTPKQTVSSRNNNVQISATNGTITATDAVIESRNNDIILNGNEVLAEDATLTTRNNNIDLDADETLSVDNATIETRNNLITLDAANISARYAFIKSRNNNVEIRATKGDNFSTLDATGAELISGNNDIILRSDGELILDQATISAGGSAVADVSRATYTLYVDGTSITDRDNILNKIPDNANEDPERNDVQ